MPLTELRPSGGYPTTMTLPGRGALSRCGCLPTANCHTPTTRVGHPTRRYIPSVLGSTDQDGGSGNRTIAPPLLLLDVDGILQPTGSSVPPGFQRFTDATSDVILSLQHGEWLQHLASRFEIVWVTTWGSSANALIVERLGLQELRHIELGAMQRGGTRKLGPVRDFVADRPLAWVDDELNEDALEWAEARSAPTLLLRTSANVGLTLSEVTAPGTFADEWG